MFSRIGLIFLISFLAFLRPVHGQAFELAFFESGVDVPVKDIPKLEYTLAESKVLSFAGGNQVYVHLRIDSIEDNVNNSIFLSYSLLDSISLYYRDQVDFGLRQKTGQAFKFETRLNAVTDFSFDLKPGVHDYYFKVTSHKPLVLPFEVIGNQDLLFIVSSYDFFMGIYIGIVFVMLLYNLVLYFLTRDKSYLFYILYLLFLGLAQAALFGYTDRFLFANSPLINTKFSVLSGALVGIASVAFIVNFLRLKVKAPLYYNLLRLVVVLDLIGIVALFSGFEAIAYNWVNFVALGGSIIAIVAAVKLARSGYKPANFFLIAWSVFLISVIVFALKDLEILPYNPFLRRSMLFGSSFEIVLLSVALADRINQLRREKEQSQAKALEMAKENEKIIKEQNVELERRVDSRTMELQESNEELQVALDNLKETQSQLVDSEKMASLGQLTAGIAHEINNPINFIASNIKPLKLDLSEIYDIVASFQALDEDSSSDDLLEAKAKLEEYDYEFLKTEIEGLVGGISDGAVRTSEIVLGLRNFSRLDEDVVKKASPNEGLENTLVLLRNNTKDLIDLDEVYDENVGEIDCFPGKLNQTFMNILNNAIYAVNAKVYAEGEKPTIGIKTEKLKDGWVVIKLSDNGIGMDENTKKKLFEPFFTTKDVGEGTGLGMSIVFKIIERHGGKLIVNSQLGVGTEFIMTLPVNQPNEFA
jgi:two-component system NtrC family sensor kinase